jgi:hypothetical protein
MPRALEVGLVVALAALSAPAWAQAETEEDRAAAQREFAEGQRAFSAKDYRHAAEQFDAAYKHKRHHSALWNAARAWQRAGEPVRAANLYSRFLREAPPDSRDRNTAHAALSELSSKLGRLEIHASGMTDITVDGAPAGDDTVWVSPGSHAVEGKHQGKPVRQTASVDGGQSVSVTLVPPSASQPPPGPPPKPAIEPPPDRGSSGGWSPAVFWVGAGLTAVATGLAVWSGVDTLQSRTAYDTSPSQEALDEGRGKQTRTNVFIGVAGGLALLTAVTGIFLVDWKGAEDRSVKVGMGFAGTGRGAAWLLSAHGTF